MQNLEIKNRRVSERVPVKFSLRLLDLYSNRYSVVQVQDICTQGIGVLADEELPPYTPLEMWLPILNKDESLHAKGEVVWSKMIEPNKYRTGIKLEEVDSMGIMQLIWGYIMAT